MAWPRRLTRRSFVQRGVAASAGLAGLLLAGCGGAPAAAPAGGSSTASSGKKLAGTSIKVMMVEHPYADVINTRRPDFEAKTGIQFTMDTMSFINLNQRADLELSSATGAYDAIHMIFIRSGKWIGAGWAEKLNPFLDRLSAAEKDEFALDDFVAGALAPFKRGNDLYALPWLADTTMVAYRKDVLEKSGLSGFPQTYDDFQAAAPKIQAQGLAAFVTQNNLHWIWPNWLMSYGGNYFANPPDDLTPTFDTDPAHKTAEMFTTLLSKYSVPGGMNLDPTVAELAMGEGKAASFIDGLGNLQVAIDPTKSKVGDKIVFAPTPRGPSGHFPQLAVHGFLINPASKKKDAAWEFIRWATGKDVMLWGALNKNHLACTRSSVLNNPEVKKKFNWNGTDLPALHEQVMKQAGTGYMAYRTVPQFPPIGDRVVIALTSIASGQATVDAALKSLQKDAIAILEKQGVKVKK